MMFPLDQKALDAIETCRKTYANHIEILRKDLEPLPDWELLGFGQRSRDGHSPHFHAAVWAEIRRRVMEMPITGSKYRPEKPPEYRVIPVVIEVPIPKGARPAPQP